MIDRTLKRFYREFEINGRSADGKLFRRHWLRYADAVKGDCAKQAMLANAIHFQVKNRARAFTGHELKTLMDVFRQLGLLAKDAPGNDELETYLQSERVK